MSDSPFQIFISYARDDDAVPPRIVNATGFVTFLHEQLEFALQNRGPHRPKIWRDTIGIEKADQFEEIIETEIAKSSILLVVLSHNWMSRPFCRRELESFAQRWREEGEPGTRRRIIVVGKRHVETDQRPPLLQGQEGFTFYALDDRDKSGSMHEFFGRTGPQDDRYWQCIDKLADRLMRVAGYEQARAPASAPAPTWNGRTIYVAKPATDMRKAYDRLVKELQQREFRVVPDPAADIPYDGTARDVIDKALAQSEVSIHFLGEKHGPTPEDAQPVVDLQLARARARVLADTAEGQGLRRIIWAPTNVDSELGFDESVTGRDPLAVLGRFSEQLPTDKVSGDALSKFVDFLVQNLDRVVPSRRAVEPAAGPANDRSYYVYYWPKDRRFAVNIAKALRDKNVQPVLAAVDGDEAERNALHRQRLQECDAIVLCWGAASETWAITSASELRNWRDLGRSRKFSCRGLVVGPPPHEVKADIVELPPKSEIDVIVDLTSLEQPTPDALNPLFAPGP